jgi:alkanesulfonate monooxygenase
MRLFAISPRSRDPELAWRAIDTTIRLADSYGFTGVLAHTGNDTLMDPWLVGQHALDVSPRLQPLVAVNPIYHHPFAAAQLAASLTYRYQRRIFLNLVIGTSGPDRTALGDTAEHDQRYRRLREYGQIMLGLLGTSAPVSLDGEFYQLRGARLALPGPPDLRPVPFIAGHSPMARECAAALGAVRIVMFGADAPAPADDDLGEYAGLLVRQTDTQAWQAARARYPADPDLEAAGAAALRYTDAAWRHESFRSAAGQPSGPPWYWTEPMRSLRADCPLLVGGVDTVADVLGAHRRAGVGAFIFDLAAQDEDFAWAARAIERSASR